jgi:hypothetical protein
MEKLLEGGLLELSKGEHTSTTSLHAKKNIFGN